MLSGVGGAAEARPDMKYPVYGAAPMNRAGVNAAAVL